MFILLRRDRVSETSRSLQGLGGPDGDYVKRNVGNLAIQLMSVQEKQSANRNHIDTTVHQIMKTSNTMYIGRNGNRQLGGQRTDFSGVEFKWNSKCHWEVGACERWRYCEKSKPGRS